MIISFVTSLVLLTTSSKNFTDHSLLPLGRVDVLLENILESPPSGWPANYKVWIGMEGDDENYYEYWQWAVYNDDDYSWSFTEDGVYYEVHPWVTYYDEPISKEVELGYGYLDD
jgi:hypothetical protein